MLFRHGIICLVLTTFLVACSDAATRYEPVIDGPLGEKYPQDLNECRSLAASQGSLGNDAGGKAAAGAGIAAATTAIFNNSGTNVLDAAVVGAAAGLTASAFEQNKRKERIIRNCLKKRGYAVVD